MKEKKDTVNVENEKSSTSEGKSKKFIRIFDVVSLVIPVAVVAAFI